jgi:hypothetical protein
MSDPLRLLRVAEEAFFAGTYLLFSVSVASPFSEV